MYEEHYHSAFAQRGYTFLGARTNKQRLLEQPPLAIEDTAHEFGIATLFSAEELACCLMEAYQDGPDLSMGLYTPFTFEAFLAYSRAILDGAEGDLIADACVAAGTPGNLRGFVIVAQTVARTEGTKRAIIVELAILSKWQGRKLGQALMTRALAKLLGHGYREVVLQHSAQNGRAERLYLKLGFKDVGERVFRSEISGAE